jgi:polyisoprenoid-binding protein YceI
MKKILPLLFLLISTAVTAQRYVPQDNGSKVHFNIRNFGIKTGGQLSGLKGEIVFFTTDLSACHFNVSVDVSTIDTDSDSRDRSLRSDEYFDEKKYPQLTIVSTKIDKTNKTDQGYYYFTGNLTIKGITKEISFPFHVEKVNDDYLFTGQFSLNRLDYGVGSNSAVLSNTVDVSLSVLAKKG